MNCNINIFETFYKPSNLKEFNIDLNYVAFSGIGNSENFFHMLNENKFKIIKKLNFPDHYNYTENDLLKIWNLAKSNNAEIITTEKDYLRLSEKNSKKIKFLKLELVIVEEQKLINLLMKK